METMGIMVKKTSQESTFAEFQHECSTLAHRIMFPVVAEWDGEEYIFTQFDWCPCPRCCERNPDLQRPNAP